MAYVQLLALRPIAPRPHLMDRAADLVGTRVVGVELNRERVRQISRHHQRDVDLDQRGLNGAQFLDAGPLLAVGSPACRKVTVERVCIIQRPQQRVRVTLRGNVGVADLPDWLRVAPGPEQAIGGGDDAVKDRPENLLR